jgi:hypothetical protein
MESTYRSLCLQKYLWQFMGSASTVFDDGIPLSQRQTLGPCHGFRSLHLMDASVPKTLFMTSIVRMDVLMLVERKNQFHRNVYIIGDALCSRWKQKMHRLSPLLEAGAFRKTGTFGGFNIIAESTCSNPRNAIATYTAVAESDILHLLIRRSTPRRGPLSNRN